MRPHLLAAAGVYVVAGTTDKPKMPVVARTATGVIAWLGSLTFAALGRFIGHLLPPENVMR